MKKISRKSFLIGGAGAAVAAAGACFCTKTGRATLFGVGATPEIARDAYDVAEDGEIRIYVDKVSEFASAGGAVKIFDSRISGPLIVARTAEDTYVAASIQCTHRGVEVEYHPEGNCFQCASLGGSRFETNGKKIGGFAKGPLKTFPASCEDGILVIHTS